MEKITLKALRQSIQHWERMVKNGYLGADQPTGGQCALCRRFDGACMLKGEKCPVYEVAGRWGCTSTPFNAACDAWERNDADAFKAAAQKEVDFLKSLLPEDA